VTDETPPSTDLPPGVRLWRTLRGHTGPIGRIAWSPNGRVLASPSSDSTLRLWDVERGACVHTLAGPRLGLLCAAFHPFRHVVAGGGHEGTVRLWDSDSGRAIRTLEGHARRVNALAFQPEGDVLASVSDDGSVRLWDTGRRESLRTLRSSPDPVPTCAFHPGGSLLAGGRMDGSIGLWSVPGGALVATLTGHRSTVFGLAFAPGGALLASASHDRTVMLWDAAGRRPLQALEGHTSGVLSVAFSSDGALLASISDDDTVRLWRCDTWEPVAVVAQPVPNKRRVGLAFHPAAPVLAAGVQTAAGEDVVVCWELDVPRLLARPAAPSVAYTTAKVVLVGESGAGKTGLGWRLAKGEFRAQPSTHGQQFWPLEQLRATRPDGTECEAVLWDLAGQPDYRLIHALFLDEADLALVVFDPTHDYDPLRGVEYWLEQLRVGQDADAAASGPVAILVAARTDRGDARVTREDIEAYCRRRGIRGYVRTSAITGAGLDELVERMRELIPWERRPATVTTVTFKRIKDHVLALKERPDDAAAILTPAELRRRLEAEDPDWAFTDAELLTAVGHLANHGYVARLTTSRGEVRVLLAPERLKNLASSIVLEARRHERGLGALEEQRLLAGGYRFPELDGLTDEERDVLLDSAVALFLGHDVCFRETDPLTSRTYLVFPELINLKKPPLADEPAVDEGAAYTVGGPVENVFASLVVLLGYTHTFTRTAQWQHHARYEVGDGLVCGFRQEGEREGELDFVLYYGANVGAPIRTLFQSLFEAFLARRDLTVRRFEPVACVNGHPLDRAVVRGYLSRGKHAAFCPECGERTALPDADAPIQLTREEAADMEAQRRAADQRSRFEQAVFRLKAFVAESGIPAPTCFVSYAWGDPEHERWVERALAADLLKAGIVVVLDRWENARIGASVSRFVERVVECDRVIVVGTPRYRAKYENRDPMRGFVVAAEGDLIGHRMLGTEDGKGAVLPVLAEGTPEASLPRILQGRVYADFRRSESYFVTAFDVMRDLYRLPVRDPAVTGLRESLLDPPR
jgi:GTPase SAR1 family protein